VKPKKKIQDRFVVYVVRLNSLSFAEYCPAMTQPNPASTPHGFVPDSPQASKRVLQG